MATVEQDSEFIEALARLEKIVAEVERLDKAKYLNDIQRFVIQQGRENGLESIYTS